MATEADVLRTTKELLLDKGWIQGNSWSAYGMCLGHALTEASRQHGFHPGTNEVYGHVAGVISGKPVTEGECAIAMTTIIHYNDKFCRELEDVLALLDKALLEAAGKEPHETGRSPQLAGVADAKAE